MIDENRSKRVYFIGIAGSGMLPLARLAALSGYEVLGADRGLTPELRETLEKERITAFPDHDPGRLRPGDIVVYSTAISGDHPERSRAEELSMAGEAELLHRMDFLNRLVEPYPVRIGVAGTHGKTSTSSLIGWVLLELGYDPLILVGGHPLYLSNGVRFSRGRVAVFETDESDGSFLRSSATHRIVLNVDEDHLEHYGSFENIQKAFVAFASVPGLVVVNGDDPSLQELPGMEIDADRDGKKSAESLQDSPMRKDSDPGTDAGRRQCVYYGIRPGKAGGASAQHFRGEFASGSDDLLTPGGQRIRMVLPGRHFAHNALGVLALLLEMVRRRDLSPPGGFAEALFVDSFNRFPGVKRRVEYLGKARGADVYDDYGHHPTEIRAVLEALRFRKKEGKRLVVLFQPHRYTRTALHYREFADALGGADLLYLMPLYDAGEKPQPGVSSALIQQHMARADRCFLLENDDLTPAFDSVQEGDLFLSIGAGSISRIVRRHLETMQ